MVIDKTTDSGLTSGSVANGGTYRKDAEMCVRCYCEDIADCGWDA